MNRFTELPLNIQKAKRIFALSMILFCLIPVLLDTLVLTPLYVTLQADVAFSNGILTMSVYYVKDMISILAFSSAYAVIIFAVFFVDRRSAGFAVLLYSLIYLLQIPLKIIMNIFIYGSLGSADDIILDVVYLVFYYILYMLQMLAVYLFATTDTNKHLRYLAFLKDKKKKKIKDASPEQAPYVLPTSKLFSRSNPIQRSAVKMSLLVFGIKVLSRVLNDISYGAPTSFGEVLIMLVYYLSDILCGIIAYVIALLIFSFLYERLKQKKAEGDETPSASSKIIPDVNS